jgi:hypothetical protein
MTQPIARALAVLMALSITARAQNLSAVFSGVLSQRIDVPHDTALVPAAGITVEAWVFLNANPGGGHRAIARKNSGFLNQSYLLRVSGGQIVWIVKTSIDGTVTTFGPTMPTGSWHHLAGVFDNGVAKIYLDGVNVGQTTGLTGPLVNTGGTLTIGNGDGEPWAGRIDSVRIWSIPRTQSEIQEWMFYAIEDMPDLLASWHLDGNALDSTGTHHGTVIGTVTF